MDPRKFAMIASAVLIGTAGYVTVASMRHSAQKTDLYKAQEDLKNSEGIRERVTSTIEMQEMEVLRATREKDEAAKVVAAPEDLEGRKKKLTAQLDTMRQEWAATTESWSAAINKQRSAAKSLAPFNLTKPDGTVLEKCVVKDITDTGIALEHSAGVAKLTGKTIPPDMQAKYLFGWTALPFPEPAAPAPAESGGAASVKAPAEEMPPPASGTPAPAAPSADAAKIAGLEKRIAELRDKQTKAMRSEEAARQEYNTHMAKYNAARIRGGVSSSKQYADAALKRAEEIRAQINAATLLITNLERELFQLRAPAR